MMLTGSALAVCDTLWKPPKDNVPEGAVCDTPWKPPKDNIPEGALPLTAGEAAVPCGKPLVLEEREGRCPFAFKACTKY